MWIQVFVWHKEWTELLIGELVCTNYNAQRLVLDEGALDTIAAGLFYRIIMAETISASRKGWWKDFFC